MTVLPSARYWRVNSNPNPRLAPVISTVGMAYPRAADRFRTPLLCRAGAAERNALPREVERALTRKEYEGLMGHSLITLHDQLVPISYWRAAGRNAQAHAARAGMPPLAACVVQTQVSGGPHERIARFNSGRPGSTAIHGLA